MATGQRLFPVSGHLATDSDFWERRYIGTMQDSGLGTIAFCSPILAECSRVTLIGLSLRGLVKFSLPYARFCKKIREKTGIFRMDCRVRTNRGEIFLFSVFKLMAGVVVDILNAKLGKAYSYFSRKIALHSSNRYGQGSASFSGFRTFSDRQ